MAYEKRASSDAVLTATYRLLNSLARHPNLLDNPNITEDTFTEETAKSCYVALRKLKDENLDITPASLLQAGQETDFEITPQIVQTIFDIDLNGAENIQDILSTLNTATTKDTVKKKLENLILRLNEPGEIKSDFLLEQLYEADEIITHHNKNKSTLLSFSDWADEYIDCLEERKTGRKYSFGCPLLDVTFPRGATPGTITVVAAATSMGKSNFVISLENTLLEQNSPSMYLSLEMGSEDTMDRVISNRCDIVGSELYAAENAQGLIERVLQEKEALKNRDKFYFCKATSVNLSKLRNLIREFKQKARTDYGLIAIDLISSMDGFMVGDHGASTAAMIENNMNKLENLAKEENVHLLLVVQIKRDSENAKPNSIEDINYLRPSLSDIKNSGAYAEKSSQVLALFRPKYYLDRFRERMSEMDQQAIDDTDDVLEVQVLKDRSGPNSGKILKYMFDGAHSRVYPLIEEEKERDLLEGFDIDY